MTDHPVVSIGLPCYNRPDSLKRAVECIINQTYKNLEIIISNDASPDPRVRPLLDGFAEKDSRIRLYHQPIDLNCYGNYDFVLQQATGEYFMYMQDDDIWELDAIELLVGHLESNPDTAVAIGNSAYIEDTGKIWQIFTFEKQGLLTLIFGEKAPFIWMGLWRTNLLRQFDYPIGEQHGKDIIIAAESVLSHPYGYVNTDKILYFKTIYHEKARAYIKAKPFCHFEMYSTLIYRVATSKHVKNKLVVFVLIPVSCLAIVRLYAAQILFLLPVEHPVRKSVRWAFRQIGG